VKAELQHLIALQIADTSIRKLQAELEAIPQRRAEVENEFDRRAFEFKALEQSRDAARDARTQLDKELAEQRLRTEKAERDLMSSTNSKAYEAAIREADAARKRISELETKILEQMEAGDQAEKNMAEREPELERLRGEFDERLKSFEDQTRAKAAEIEAKRAERERIFSELPPAAKSVYHRISARIRDGIALAEARNSSCSACFMALRPQVMAQVRRGEEIIQCDNCNRILYYLPAEQVQTAP
jgi:predicted  nucleic acid-binding Zn-ribbon protein